MADDTKDDVTTEETPVEEGKVEDVTAAEDEGYQFDDDLTSSEPNKASAPASTGGRGGKYADEIFSKTIHAKFRTFYIDLKESVNGKFLKVSEKSRGRKSTIMMDAEDVPEMIQALQEVQKQL
ncbi:hypothetical protein JW752_04375 [Candidatus Peregrinibacteria bacterium]|nr:hypothetical protein [Candidatus Peregrinibacteria bacterium]